MINNNCHPSPKAKSKPLQLKRGSAMAFIKINPLLLEGQPAFEIDTNRLKIGDGKRRYKDLEYIANEKVKSAYDIWLDNGHTGTEEDFLQSLIGQDGKSAYEIWLSYGNEGSIQDFLDSLVGPKGEAGASAYEVWRDSFMHDPSLEVNDYIEFIQTNSWADIDAAE